MRRLLVLAVLLLCTIARAEWIPMTKNMSFGKVLPDGTPEHWQFFTEGEGSGRAEIAEIEFRKHVRIVRESGTGYAGVRQTIEEEIRPTRDYSIVGEYTASADGLARPYVRYLDANGTFLGSYECTLPATDKKRYFARVFRPHPGTKAFEVQLRAQGKAGEVRYYRGDVEQTLSAAEIPRLERKTAAFSAKSPGMRCAAIYPGLDLSMTLVAETGIEVRVDYRHMMYRELDERIEPVWIDGRRVPIAFKGDAWVQVLKPRLGKTDLRISAPDFLEPYVVCLRPVIGDHLMPLKYGFGGWDRGNYGQSSRWLGSSQILIADDRRDSLRRLLRGD